MANGDICKIQNCNNLITHKGKICNTHRWRWERYKSYDEPLKQKLPDGIIKICKIHGELTEDKIYRCKKEKRNGIQYIWIVCIECENLRKNKWQLENPKRSKELASVWYKTEKGIISRRKKQLKKYDLTIDQYNSMLKSQNNVCAICMKEEIVISGLAKKFKNMAVDHDHKTGKIRGILCHNCNRALGHFHDSETKMISAIKYIRRNR